MYILGCKVQVAGHCFTVTETFQSVAKMLTLGLNTMIIIMIIIY